jgi:hypothetical protein
MTVDFPVFDQQNVEMARGETPLECFEVVEINTNDLASRPLTIFLYDGLTPLTAGSGFGVSNRNPAIPHEGPSGHWSIYPLVSVKGRPKPGNKSDRRYATL